MEDADRLTVFPLPAFAFAKVTTGTSETWSPSSTSIKPGVSEFVAMVAEADRSYVLLLAVKLPRIEKARCCTVIAIMVFVDSPLWAVATTYIW